VAHSSWVRVSIDSGYPETYQRTRNLPNERGWFQTWDNVDHLVSVRDAAESDLVIGLGFVVNVDNWREIIPFVQRAQRSGVDNVRLSAVFSHEGAAYYSKFGEQAAALAREAKADFTTERFTVVDNFANRSADLEQGRPDYRRCAYQHFTTYIGADLNLYRCCVLAYNEQGKIVSLANQTLEQAWMGEKKHADFRQFDARSCERCMFNDRNRQMNSMIDGAPTIHENFV
jgi:hypothetical protein